MSQNITMKSGEHRVDKTTSLRTYFFYVTPTGFEVSLMKSPLKSEGSFNNETTLLRERETVYSTPPTQDLKIKMCTSKTEFGRQRENYTVFIKLDEKDNLITISGVNGFGLFQGRGTIEVAKDSQFNPLSETQLKKVLNYRIMAPGINGKKNGTKIAPRRIFY